MRIPALSILLLCLALGAGCAAKTDSGPGVTVWENGVARTVSQREFDEKNYPGRGFYRTTGPDGKPLYVRIAASDARKDTTFISGSGVGKERSFGGLDGQFTGKPTPTGVMMMP